MADIKLRRLRFTAIVSSVLLGTALTGSAVAAAADSGRPHAGKTHTGSACGPVERRLTLAIEQARVLKLLKGFMVLRNQADLDRLGLPNPKTGTAYNVLPHMYASMGGVGFTVVNTGPGGGGPGKPPLIFYRPNPRAADARDAFGADFPYTFVGWGYVSPYTPGVAPSFAGDPGLRCIVPNDSFIHERSVHPSDTWHNIAVPPAEDYLGQSAGAEPPTEQECDCVMGLNHGRFWDTHLFLTGGLWPQVSMFNPGKPNPGFPTGTGFFRPASGPS